MKFRKVDGDKDIEFIKCCIQSEEYKKFIYEYKSIDTLNLDNIFIIEEKNKYGVLEINNKDILNNNVNMNIYMRKKKSFLNIVVMFKAVSYIIKDLKFHKILIKVNSKNFNMISILNKMNITLEGIIPECKNNYTNLEDDIYIYSILDYEYEFLKKHVKQKLR